MRRALTLLPFDLQGALSHCKIPPSRPTSNLRPRCHNYSGSCSGFRPPSEFSPGTTAHAPQLLLATEQELTEFLKSVEKRAFKRSVYHVRNEESALDIVQESMMKLAEHYGHKPAAELPMLFQRILSNCTLDWFRRQKSRSRIFSNFSDFQPATDDDDDFDLLAILPATQELQFAESTQSAAERSQTLLAIEIEIAALPGRQREAFLLRYWEELDTAETAAAMGCSEGSVKTHCYRAIQALANALRAKGTTP